MTVPDAAMHLYKRPFFVGESGKEISTGSLSSLNNLKILNNLLGEKHPARTLPNGQHIAIDPFQRNVWDSCGTKALDQAGLAGYCTVINEFSSTALARLHSEKASFEMIYIDGSHLFEDVFIDMYFCVRLLEHGGIVLFDDASDPHVAKVLRFLRRNLTDALRQIDLAKYREKASAIGSLKYRMARLVNRTQLVAFERIGEPVRPWNAPFNAF